MEILQIKLKKPNYPPAKAIALAIAGRQITNYKKSQYNN